MGVNLSVKNVPDALSAKLRERAERNHRSLQGELMAILESAAGAPHAGATPADGLLERLLAIAGSRGIDTTKRLTREQLVYAFSKAPRDAAKARVAREWIAREGRGESVQILQELYVNAVRKPNGLSMRMRSRWSRRSPAAAR